MVTPDFEDWLARQEFPIEETATVDRFTSYLAKELGIRKGSLDVARDFYRTQYEVLPNLGIRSFKLERTIRGYRIEETRYGISGLRGAFGARRALEIAYQRAMERGWFADARTIEQRLRRLGG
jgi:hypothetical protein